MCTEISLVYKVAQALAELQNTEMVAYPSGNPTSNL
jgi:hypothetical protein